MLKIVSIVLLLTTACMKRSSDDSLQTFDLDAKFKNKRRPFNNPRNALVNKADQSPVDAIKSKGDVRSDETVVFNKNSSESDDHPTLVDDSQNIQIKQPQTKAHEQLVVPELHETNASNGGTFSIQAGVFKNHNNAESVKSGIIASGNPNVVIKNEEIDGQTFYKVRVYDTSSKKFNNKDTAMTSMRKIVSKTGNADIMIVEE